MPDITTSINRAEQPAIVDTSKHLGDDALSGHNLIGAHDEQHIIGIKHAVLGNDVKQAATSKEGSREIAQVSDPLVFRIRPPHGELEGVGLHDPCRGRLISAFTR